MAPATGIRNKNVAIVSLVSYKQVAASSIIYMPGDRLSLSAFQRGVQEEASKLKGCPSTSILAAAHADLILSLELNVLGLGCVAEAGRSNATSLMT